MEGECCEFDEGYRRPHNDLNKGQKNIKNSPEECCEDCRNTDGCVAWVLTPKNQCWLKHTIGEKQAGSGFYTGTMTRCEIEGGYRRPGNDLNKGQKNIKKSPEECCEDCRNTDGCVAWVLTPKKQCWLKHTIGEKRAQSGYKTGTITPTQPPPPTEAPPPPPKTEPPPTEAPPPPPKTEPPPTEAPPPPPPKTESPAIGMLSSLVSFFSTFNTEK
ncbi:uncharacterized protein [Ptychodera flava]|uniref:uncharacterized protein n=1 Tax=Ptychodera flava TaxID=63121 RepID=UPI00396A3B4C